MMCQDFSVCAFTGNTIENASVTGVQLENSGATFNGDVIQNNTNNGIVLYASHARVTDVRITGTIAGAGVVWFGVVDEQWQFRSLFKN